MTSPRGASTAGSRSFIATASRACLAALASRKYGAFRPPLLTGVLLVLALAPAAAHGQSDIEARIARVERLLDGGALVQMLEDLETLRNEVQALRGEIEVQSNTIAQLKARQRELYVGLDERLLDLERTSLAHAGPAASADTDEPMPAATEPDLIMQADAGVARPPTTVDSSVPETAVARPLVAKQVDEGAVTGSGETLIATAEPTDEFDSPAPEAAFDPVREQQDYQAAFNLLKGGRYHDAAKAFRSFLVTYSDGEFVDNARYWLGETYYVDRQLEAALAEFRELIARFPQSPKFTHAMLKVGYIHHELGRPEQAEQALLELVENHPDSTAAGLARKRLKRLQSG